jgi:hypothetical protein
VGKQFSSGAFGSGWSNQMNPYETLSSFTLARMLNDCAEGSAMERQIQDELFSRAQSVEHTDSKTPWLFSDEELKVMRKKWGPLRSAHGR